MTLQISANDWATAKLYWSNIKNQCLTTTQQANNKQVEFIDTIIFNNAIQENENANDISTTHVGNSVRVPSLRTINKLMDEIENETKEHKSQNDTSLSAVIETKLSERIRKYISKPVCCTVHSIPLQITKYSFCRGFIFFLRFLFCFA